ncbi:MAG: NAD(P)-binding domain-containing protein, partial [Oscillospiraceae bacterium]|nr:NAD(P)-binding domain-containing protein [Oscillospiraceae bacterium]
MKKADIAMIGLAVMGKNLAKNMLSKGFRVAVYDLHPEQSVAAFAEEMHSDRVVCAYDLENLVASLQTPRILMMMIRAGQPVDDYLTKLLPMLSPGDILVDGGNSHFADTARRVAQCQSQGVHFVGCGVSGGEEGALHGPSLMPGGAPAAWPAIGPILQTISAKAADGTPCCDWVGEGGAGHFVKMVHNGIEYGDMQLICETYHIMTGLLGMDA